MKNTLYILIFILLPFISCSSEKQTNSVQSPKSDDVIVENGNSLLWKVEGDDIKTSYLFGTMHLINAEYYVMSENLKSRIIGSEAIIMEVSGMPNPVKAFEMMSLDSGSVHDYFTKEQLITILQFMDKEFDLSPEEFDRTYGSMKPFVILQAISQNYFDKDTRSYDLEIMGMAGQNDIPLIGLETIEEQLGFFDQIPTEAMAEMIVSGLDDFELEKKNTLQLMKIYSKQRVDRLIPLMNKQSPEFMEYSDLFLYDRNNKWIPKLIDQMNEKHCFTAVGAGHLFGEGGVIELLKSKGYKLTAISTL